MSWYGSGRARTFSFTVERIEHERERQAVLLVLNGLRVSEVHTTNIEHLAFQRGHYTLAIVGKGHQACHHPHVPRAGPARSHAHVLQSAAVPLDMGDLPAWLQVVGGSAQLAQAMWAHQKSRADDLRKQLKERSGLSIEAIAARVAADPALAALLLASIESAMRTASSEKRGVLAAVTAKGFTDAEVNLDELTVLQRTAAEVEEYDMAVLAEIAKPRPDRLRDLDPGAIVWNELTAGLPPGLEPDTLRPVLAHLMALALVDDSAVGTWDYTPRWRASEYGFRFLNFLPVDRTLFDRATVVCSWHSTLLRVRNLGWGPAIVLSVDASWDGHPLRFGLPCEFLPTGRAAP